MTVALRLGEFITESKFEDLPSLAKDYGEMLIASTIASAAVGFNLSSSSIIRQLEIDRGGKPESTIWFDGSVRLPAAAAARVNAVASDAAASDDSDLRNIVHQGTTACASALAVGERLCSSGEEIVAAIVLGYETAGRISTVMQCTFKDKGFHGSIIAAFAGAAAAARLMRLSVDKTAQALLITATSVGGLNAAADTSVAREYHAGQAATSGVQAALAAARGFTVERELFEMKLGFFDCFGRDADASLITNDFGSRWNILTEMGIKLVPGGHPHHGVAEAAAKAARDAGVEPEEVELIEISRPGYAGFANPHNPTDLIGMAHSAIFFAAAGVADRDFSWIHASADKITDPRIRMLLDRVRMVAPPTSDLDRYKGGARVTIVTKDGKRTSATVYAPKGAAILGIDWIDVEAKYRTLVGRANISADNIQASLGVVRTFRQVESASALLNLLR
ncbi:hypothetical protein NK8_63700 (plasmid) [Caballeronia sp. NK8]|uniref:MmgE/PrpD family protein n=1 Tax=Caballeronia sp. NK8 TaxID=140098 RepID=UPI001BB634A5|nr:MmgE/PrpD family protein [Caballeronia sp. NK8]BCQ28181.1 hypothetical protein NK8_63700 [Caballeronia sp. NK8]